MGRYAWGSLIVLLALGAAGCNRQPRCGNGVIEETEICDDGNEENNDGCDAVCQVEACFPGPNGNGRVCFSLVEASAFDDPGYDYPEPLNDSAQYSPPVRYLDLDAINLTRMVAANFAIGEMVRPDRGQYAVVQAHAVETLQEIRDDVGALRVNSGYRSPGHNASIPGSATYSRHQYGDAFDLDPLDTTLGALESACNQAGASYVGVYETHRHCDWRLTTLDRSFYGTDLQGSGQAEVPLDIASFRTMPQTDAWLEIVDDKEGWYLAAPAEGWDEGEPLREWTAYDASGRIVDEQTSRTYVPPDDAVEVEVVVGREVVRSIWL